MGNALGKKMAQVEEKHSKSYRKGKFLGYCPKCGLPLAKFDIEKSLGVWTNNPAIRCPCGELTNVADALKTPLKADTGGGF